MLCSQENFDCHSLSYDGYHHQRGRKNLFPTTEFVFDETDSFSQKEMTVCRSLIKNKSRAKDYAATYEGLGVKDKNFIGRKCKDRVSYKSSRNS